MEPECTKSVANPDYIGTVLFRSSKKHKPRRKTGFCLYNDFLYDKSIVKNIRILLIACTVAVVAFFSFVPDILRNNVSFDTDEMYWIQTARMLPYILEGKFQSPYWHENMGFTNFNGAKWYYAITLNAIGFKEKDFNLIGIPPDTYYKWKDIGIVFPPRQRLYPLLKTARLFSALAVSIGMALLFLSVIEVFNGDIIVAIFATLLLRFHPIILYIATHALADSVFLVGQLTWLNLVIRIGKSKRMNSIVLLIAVGACIGFTASVKINGAMLYVLTLGILLLKNRTTPYELLIKTLIVTFASEFTFFVVNPNIFFYPQYPLWMMITDRIAITKYQMTYYLIHNPPHVLLTIPQRVQSFYYHVFNPIVLSCFGLSIVTTIPLLKNIKNKTVLLKIGYYWILAVLIFISLLSYVVFDEQRYFLPVLPFIITLCSVWVYVAKNYIVSLGRYWSASAK